MEGRSFPEWIKAGRGRAGQWIKPETDPKPAETPRNSRGKKPRTVPVRVGTTGRTRSNPR